MTERTERVKHGDLLELKRWNTPTVYNGWEQITHRDRTRDGINLEETRDFMPAMGPMVGYAVTLVVEPSNPDHRETNPDAWSGYRRYVANVPGPKIAVVQDLDRPQTVGSFGGEVNVNAHAALGCVGTITDGVIRDADEMTDAGFKALARRLCVGHAHVSRVRWNREVTVFGQTVLPGQLIHADKHGFLAATEEEEPLLLEAAKFMDANECHTVIPAARSSAGRSAEEVLRNIDTAFEAFGAATRERFGGPGEW